ncbi:5'-nucleotidase [Flavobacterium davisii]|uniref:5'-nucleotidase n=1 Tax=Flavobacterium columnare TaxID=996 RepID=A0A8G0KWD4_9FLAO|nr:5'-nucleotidase [Flavobacterium davisii]QYS89649.1 hypothetical protein JJC05_05140 [Flavobacterium davisii]
MSLNFAEILVIGVSTRALFNLETENQIFDTQGIEAFRDYQLQHEDEILEPRNSFLFSTKFIRT